MLNSRCGCPTCWPKPITTVSIPPACQTAIEPATASLRTSPTARTAWWSRHKGPDRDFRDSHLLQNLPRRLLVVATGNIANDDLLALFEANLSLIADAFENASLVEISEASVVIHDGR